ncbi:uncharacterized protein IUM83_07683 [Phytophthora cinnamomi]|uniref:uncharacterized protein n=1 Tax=Phytophthora cinnamomi TaxID=4785 RepID=UPI00355A8491|nr:hypothetical protein IUM83_07683 [Phytophthora cinnamomi]
MLKVDGQWPTEKSVLYAATRPTVVTNSVDTEFEDAGNEGHVHLLVELTPGTHNVTVNADDQDQGGAADEEARTVDEPAESTNKPEDPATEIKTDTLRFNNACGLFVTGKQRKHITDDSSDGFKHQHMAFSDFTNHQTKRMFLGVDQVNIQVEEEDLPDELVAAIKARYDELIKTSKAPWDQPEAQRRRYIDALITPVIAAVNAIREPSKGNIEMLPEYAIQDASLMASGIADWVIIRGDRMLVSIEAKQCDIFRGQHQLLAMLEAARIINGGKPLQKTYALITDFQNWIRPAFHLRTLV